MGNTLKGDVNSFKFNAYREIAYDLEDAISKIEERKLAFGEPSCVLYNYPNGDNAEKRMMLMGVGGLNGENFYITLEQNP